MTTEINHGVNPTRRTALVGLASCAGLLAAGCRPFGAGGGPTASLAPDAAERMYAGVSNERFAIPPVKLSRLDQRFVRREVAYTTTERPGTVIVDTREFYLYHVGRGGRAMRYGVGLGRQGFEWSGRGTIAWKRKWPTWTPPNEMIAREPRLKPYSAANGGMKPGLRNPLGARALYIYQNGEDTLYRLHGTRSARSIGKAVSSGCVRLLNQDVIHLYDRVKPGSKILVV
ncbi:MAG: L,D-transpeptidase [Pseudomonadota bacterium]